MVTHYDTTVGKVDIMYVDIYTYYILTNIHVYSMALYLYVYLYMYILQIPAHMYMYIVVH